jgi:hypothetical protein
MAAFLSQVLRPLSTVSGELQFHAQLLNREPRNAQLIFPVCMNWQHFGLIQERHAHIQTERLQKSIPVTANGNGLLPPLQGLGILAGRLT